MGTNFPPDGWEVTEGTWGTNINQDTTAGKFLTGDSSIKMDTAALTEISSDFIPLEELATYKIKAVVQASANAGADLIGVRATQYDAAKAFTSFAVSQLVAVTTINTFEVREYQFTASAGSKFIKAVIRKDTSSFDVYIDSLGIERTAPKFLGYLSSGQNTGANGTVTKILYDGQTYDYGAIFDPATYKFTARYSGVFHFNACVHLSTVDDGALMELYLYRDTVFEKRLDAKAMGSQTNCTLCGGADIEMVKGEDIDVRVYNGSSGVIAMTTGVTNSWFSGHEIR